jgi:type I restriction enzyme S subunit
VFTTKQQVIPLFLYYCLNYCPDIKRQVLKSKQGGTRYALGFKKLKKFNIDLPVRDEQQKIADLLSSVDQMINSKIKTINSTELWKKGLMQQLFI